MKIKTSEGEQNVTSQSQGTINTVLAAIGAAGALTMGGGLLGQLGGGNRPPQNDGDRPVTRYEMSLFQQINDEKTKNALLEAKGYTDKTNLDIQKQFGMQNAWNAMQQQNIATIQQQLGDITKFVVPIASIDPVPATQSGSTNTQSNG